MIQVISEKHLGERVRSHHFGDGTIISFENNTDHPVVVEFDSIKSTSVRFTTGGIYPQIFPVDPFSRNIHIIPPVSERRIGYKLFSIRKDGTLGPLFIDRALRITLDVWHVAEEVPTRGYAFRPGWHICAEQSAPHLKERDDRVWAKVEFCEFKEMRRPDAQGGLWFIAKYMKVLEILPSVN